MISTRKCLGQNERIKRGPNPDLGVRKSFLKEVTLELRAKVCVVIQPCKREKERMFQVERTVSIKMRKTMAHSKPRNRTQFIIAGVMEGGTKQ